MQCVYPGTGVIGEIGIEVFRHWKKVYLRLRGLPKIYLSGIAVFYNKIILCFLHSSRISLGQILA